MRVTDGQTDRILLAIPRLHYMQRGNKPTRCKYALRADEGDFEPERQSVDVPGLLHFERQRYDDVLQIGLGRRREVNGVLL